MRRQDNVTDVEDGREAAEVRLKTWIITQHGSD